MEEIKGRYDAMVQALSTLEDAIALFERVNVSHKPLSTHEEGFQPIEFDSASRAFRDSMIQRFEYSVDLLWKYLKDYLETVLKITLEVYGPKSVVRSCSSARILTEQETKRVLEMIDNRNMTSHIYREEIAQIIAKQVPEFYSLMELIVRKTNPPKD